MGSVASANAANFGAPAGAALPQTFVEIPKTEERAITLAQLKMVWAYIEEHAGEWTDTFEGSPTYQQPLHTLTVNLHHVKDNMIKPFTEEARCSFVERIAQGPQPPQWFVSHWWGEEVCQFLACVEEHARLRHLGTAVAYWICAYANNQWRIEDEIQCNPRETPFFKAMSLSVGTLSIVDSAAVTYTRIWCSFEVSVALTDMGVDYLYDIAATNGDAQVVVLTDGVTPADEEEGRRLRWYHVGGAYGHLLNRQRNFPIKVFELGFRVKLEEGKATEDCDSGVPAESR